MSTNYDNLRATGANAKFVSILPSSPADYYGVAEGDSHSNQWVGGELVYLSTDNRLYLQSATSGKVATWLRLADAFETSTSTSTTTSSSTSTSTSTSSTTTS